MSDRRDPGERREGDEEPTVVDPYAAHPPQEPHAHREPWGTQPPPQPPPQARPWGDQGQWGPPLWQPPAQPTGWAPPSAPGAWPPPQHNGWPPPPGQGWQGSAAYGPWPQPRLSDQRDPWNGAPLSGEERFWVPAVHWLPLFTTWLGPLVVLLTIGERNARVREHAKESLNFEVTIWLLILVAALLTYVLIGYLFLVMLPFVAVVLRLSATLEAFRGRNHRYPFSLRIIR